MSPFRLSLINANGDGFVSAVLSSAEVCCWHVPDLARPVRDFRSREISGRALDSAG